MMKKNKFIPKALSTALLLLTAHNALAADTPNLEITGTIVSRTCSVSAESQNMTVQMGNASNKQFFQAGEGANYVPVTVHLEKCGKEANQVSVTFTGTPDSVNPNLLALGADAQAATGVAIALYDGDKTLIPINTATDPSPLEPSSANVALPFYARYLATGSQVRSGTANAVATFSLVYD